MTPLELAVQARLGERRRRRDRHRLVAACVVAAMAGILAPVGAMYAWRQVAIWFAAVEPEPQVAASIASDPRPAARLPEEGRRAVYRALVEAEDRALADAVGAGLRGREPGRRGHTEALKHQHRRFVELADRYRSDAASHAARVYGIGPDQIREIELEGARSDWIADVDAPPLPEASAAERATPPAEPSPTRAVAEVRRAPVLTSPAATVRPARQSSAPAHEQVALPPRPSSLVRPNPSQSASSDTSGGQ